LTDWAQISSGFASVTAAIKTNGTLWAWGRNNNGQLALGDVTNRDSPVQVGALTNWAKVVAASGAIKTDGTLWAWGQNYAGGLGDNTTANKSSPVQVGSLTTWLQVSAGRTNNTLALLGV
jgi:alpha-tubulin suppressor-like RCC1 family protein